MRPSFDTTRRPAARESARSASTRSPAAIVACRIATWTAQNHPVWSKGWLRAMWAPATLLDRRLCRLMPVPPWPMGTRYQATTAVGLALICLLSREGSGAPGARQNGLLNRPDGIQIRPVVESTSWAPTGPRFPTSCIPWTTIRIRRSRHTITAKLGRTRPITSAATSSTLHGLSHGPQIRSGASTDKPSQRRHHLPEPAHSSPTDTDTSPGPRTNATHKATMASAIFEAAA